jgi:hypothetical protein
MVDIFIFSGVAGQYLKLMKTRARSRGTCQVRYVWEKTGNKREREKESRWCILIAP